MELWEIRRRLHGGFRNRHDAAALCQEISSLVHQASIEEPVVQDLAREFKERLQHAEIEDIVEQHCEYATSLARKDGLVYEEMHKVFSLRDEIEALEFVGFEVTSKLKDELNAALRELFNRESRMARLVAEDRYDEWKSRWWWYRSNLVKN